jgi:hypothetical protein
MVALINGTAEIRHVDQLHLTAMGKDERALSVSGLCLPR